LERESVEYYRARLRNERKAARHATCEKAREAHEQMASAYEHLVEIAELEERGALEPGKVTGLSDALRDRDDAELGGHAPKPSHEPQSES
jgi:hypothetical protein